MSRIAGDSDRYEFRICRVSDLAVTPTEYGFSMPSVSTFIKETLAVPPSAMAWWGFKIAMRGFAEALEDDGVGLVEQTTPELLQAFFKERGVNPNMSRDEAGSRGTDAHDIAEMLVDDKFDEALEAAAIEFEDNGTAYGYAAISFYVNEVAPFVESGEILKVVAEVPVWSLRHWYCGTFDIALLWAEADVGDRILPQGWEVCDYKTHKPASGFTLDGKGAGYDSDAAQNRSYRTAVEEMGEMSQWLSPVLQEMGLGPTIGQRTIVLRETGKYLEDRREVSPAFPAALRDLYDERVLFDAKEEK